MKRNEQGALSGIKVIDLGRMVAAPYCTMMLANMGAEVIKVETPEKGDISRVNMPMQNGESAYFVAYNCSKSGITVNLKTDKGKEILKKLILEADVLVENFRPGVMERLGFSYERVSKINPQLVYASVSGFGQTGDFSDRAAFDPIAQAMSGMVSITGKSEQDHVRCGASIADVLAGQNAAFAILAALLHRQKSGKGQWIDIALTDSCISAMASVNQIYLSTGKVPKPLGNGFDASAPGNCYHTKDGSVMLLAGRNEEWNKLAQVLNHEDWLQMEEFKDVCDRIENREQLDQMISEETIQYSTEELMEKLLSVRLPAGEVFNIEQVANSDYFCKKRKMFVELEHPLAGKMKVTNLPIHMSDTQPHVYKCAPILGQDNETVLQKLGYDKNQIEELKKLKVI